MNDADGGLRSNLGMYRTVSSVVVNA